MLIIALDAGTTGVRSIAFGADGAMHALAYRELTQHFPAPGWVEHDADEIWRHAAATLREVAAQLHGPVGAIGITNQRETVVAWGRDDGRARHRAIVWQDRRTTARCEELAPHLDEIRRSTGLVLDPYFSATKIEWLQRHAHLDAGTVFGTVDAWLTYRLTGGAVFATDPSNASRTMLYDLHRGEWSAGLCELFGVRADSLPEVRASIGSFGVVQGIEGLDGVPILGVLGDQQAALFGQGCHEPGTAKNTYGTGSFLLMNVGPECPAPADGLLTTVAWKKTDGSLCYAFEGAVFSTGAAIQWLRDGLGIIATAADLGPLAATVPDSGGVVFVPAFTGLGSPWWNARARGTILGLTRGTTRAHVARAVIDAIAFQTRDVVEAMNRATAAPLTELRVDGGAAAMDLLLQVQADQLGVPVVRRSNAEATAFGAALAAGIAAGAWPIRVKDDRARVFEPNPTRQVEDSYHRWRRAVERSLDWE